MKLDELLVYLIQLTYFAMDGFRVYLVILALVSLAGAECPGSADASFNGRCYEVLPDQHDWIGAVAACSDAILNSRPLAIETEEENEFLKTWIVDAVSAVSDDLKYVWLFGSNLVENNYQWHNWNGSGVYPMEFTAWANNQPTPKAHYHCVDLNLEDNPFTWDAYPCAGFIHDGGNAYPVKDFVVCEYDES